MTAQKIVVTGGAGYVGSMVTSHLLQAGFEVIVVDRLASGGEPLLGLQQWPGFSLVAADVRDATQLRTAIDGAFAVVHLAAIVGEPACIGREADARAVNVGGTTALLDALRTSGVERLILVSTCSNYGVSDPTQLADEDAPLHPLGIYAKSKVDAELAALAFAGPAGVSVLRLGTICGLSPKMRFDLLVNEMARAAVLGDALQIFAPEAWRPFLHIRDAGRAIEWTLRRPRPASGQVYNVVGENYQKKGLADLVRRHFPAAALSVTDKIPDARDYRASGERIARDGFTPQFTVEDAFLEVVAAVRSGIFRDPRWAGHAAAPLPKE